MSTPEYAHGLPGTFKNALDLLVGSLTFPGKPIAIIATTPRAIHAPAQLREVLATMSGRVIEEASIILSPTVTTFDEWGFVADPGVSRQITIALTTFAREIASSVERQMPCG